MHRQFNLNSEKIGSYLEALSSSAPAPGGGAAVAVTLAQSCALYTMALRISFRDVDQPLPMIPQVEGLYRTLRPWLEEMRQIQETFVALGDQDAAIFSEVIAAYHRPKTTPEEKAIRHQEIQLSSKRALEVPLAMAHLGLRLIEAARYAVYLAKSNIISDCAIGTELLETGLKGAWINIAINLKVIEDDTYREKIREDVRRMERTTVEACTLMRAYCKKVMDGEV